MDTPPVVSVASLKGLLKEKTNILSNDFEKKYGSLPQFIARVPGR
jgi:hypothetical protein